VETSIQATLTKLPRLHMKMVKW